ncbi:MAG: class I SAM-dependent methyltransferase [Gudongella sp.]|nr:class I SAM-dependent methyltransferase [Gudongella sp.]
MSRGVFHAIARIYGLFYNYQKNYYSGVLEQNKAKIDYSEVKSILDVGSGTGALCTSFKAFIPEVSGVEPVERMVQISKEKTRGKDISFYVGNALEGLEFTDSSYDIVIASYVAHGMKEKERIKLYKEMYRVARKYMIIYDYNRERRFLNDIVEWLERGDYFNFIKVVETELKELFGNVRVVDVDTRAAWYIIEKAGEPDETI